MKFTWEKFDPAFIESPRISNYRISCISGEHLSIKAVGNNEIIVASISSICRNMDHLKRILGKKVMIVVDEAHHTLAPTYRNTIEFIKKSRKNTKLLGLTATPVRANEKDSKKLLDLFDNNVVYSVSMGDLIAKGILAEPQFNQIETGENFEPEISNEEQKLIQRYGELPESLVSKIAASHTRNQIIIKEYLKHKKEYGKTLIFAMNVIHCRFLYDELRKHHVKCGLIYSGKEDNTYVINDFKENKLDVLINVNIMTEGTDVPDIQTVFLTRPTQSEGLLLQMIGRGMRGSQAGGTEKVNIVDFHDKWSVFNKWLDPEWLLAEEKAEEEDIQKKEYKKAIYEEYDWKACKEVYNSMACREIEYGRTVSLPVAWYTLIDEEGELHRMILFENQMRGLKNMMEDKKFWKDNLDITPEIILQKYFSYFCNRPSERDIELLMDNIRNLELPPSRNSMEHRKEIDPYYVAKKSEETGKDLFELINEVYDEYEIVKDLYETKEKYSMEVCRAKVYRNKSDIIGLKVEELPIEMIPFDRKPFYNLDELVQEVKDQMFGGKYEGISSIEWTDKAYKTFYGVFYHNDASIRINSVLNSKDVPKEVVKFVIYHEMLHRDNHSHDATFRAEEQKYPGYEKWEYFLNDNMNKFDIEEW